MAALFQKSYEELQEVFVQARFAETPRFGQHNVQSWLAREREAERPHLPESPTVPIVSQWQRLPGSDLLGLNDPQKAAMILFQNTTPVGDFGIERMAPKIGDWKPYAQLLGTHVDGARVYVGYHTFVILKLGARYYIFRILEKLERGIQEPGLVCRSFGFNAEYTSRAVADVLLGEWNRRRHHAQEARRVLCDAINRRIEAERQRAEHDFDTAVAVSEDGTKIVKADWVVIPQYGGYNAVLSLRIFEGSAFHHSKILRSSTNYARSERTLSAQGYYELEGALDWPPKNKSQRCCWTGNGSTSSRDIQIFSNTCRFHRSSLKDLGDTDKQMSSSRRTTTAPPRCLTAASR